MEKINFEDLPSKDVPIDSTNLNLLQTNVEKSAIGVVLYDGASVSTANLNDNVSNYTYIEIFYNAFNSQCNSVKVFSSETNVISLSVIHAGTDGSLNINTRGVVLSGNQILTKDERYSATAISISKEISITKTNNITITKVVGYK